MASQTNRNLQAKYLKSRRQCAAYSVDRAERDSMYAASLRKQVDMTTAIQAKLAQRARLLAHW